MKHGYKPNTHGIAHDFDQLTLTAGAPICVSHIATCDLQTAARTLEATVSVDLLSQLVSEGIGTSSALAGR
jgi:hypothetical protein